MADPSSAEPALGTAGTRRKANPIEELRLAQAVYSGGNSPFPFLIEMRNKMDLIRIILAILLPPLGVFLQVGLAGAFWLNILLTLLGYIPGIVHAVWIIAKR